MDAKISLARIEFADEEDLLKPLYWENEIIREGRELVNCMEYNSAPFKVEEITAIRTIEVGQHDGPNWVWLVDLKDGCRFYVEGGCDYTGWDCQSSAWYTKVNR